MDMLEKMNKTFLKQILSLFSTTADPAVYILSGTIPVEGLGHKQVLSFFWQHLPSTMEFCREATGLRTAFCENV